MSDLLPFIFVTTGVLLLCFYYWCFMHYLWSKADKQHHKNMEYYRKKHFDNKAGK